MAGVNAVKTLEMREVQAPSTRRNPVPDARRASALRTRGAASLILILAVAFTLAVVAFFVAGCGGTLRLSSSWRDRDVTIDGANTEWQGATTYYEEQKLSVGVFNDDEFMYVALFVGDRRDQAQVIFHGCTVWFDPSGGDEKVMGVHFPLGMAAGGDFERPGRGEGSGAPGGTPGADSLRKVFDRQIKAIELLGPEPGEMHTQGLSENKIEVALGLHETSLIYEIKIPLARGGAHPYGIGVEPGQKEIGVGFETPEIQRPKLSEDMGQRPGGPGGMGGMPGGPGGPGGMPGGPGGERGGERPEPPSPLEVWAKVKLAAR